MRCLALARYRFLLSVRSSTMSGAFAGLITILLLAFFPMLFAWTSEEQMFPATASFLLPMMAGANAFVSLTHAVFLALVSCSLGISQRRPGYPGAYDLVETTPVRTASIYWGDVLGIFAATMALHACLFPIIAVHWAMGPFPSSILWFYEALLVLLIFFASCLAAWSLRAENWRWSLARIARGSTIVLILVLLLAGALSRRPLILSEALLQFLERGPGTLAWNEFVAAFRDPVAALIAFVSLYAAMIGFFSIHSVHRNFESS